MDASVALLLRWNEFLRHPARYAEASQIGFLYPDVAVDRLLEFRQTKEGVRVLSRRMLHDLGIDGVGVDPEMIDRPAMRLALLDRQDIWRTAMTAALLPYYDAVQALFSRQDLQPIIDAIGVENYRWAIRQASTSHDLPSRHVAPFGPEAWQAKAAEVLQSWMQSLAEPIRKRVMLKFPRAFGPAAAVRDPQALAGLERLCDETVDRCLATPA